MCLVREAYVDTLLTEELYAVLGREVVEEISSSLER
jgi:hypothetical protein